MAYSGRPLSPGSRKIQNQGRLSDSRMNDPLADQYRSDRHNSYTSPKSSAGVIPISTETFVNYPPTQTSRADQPRYDSYGRLLEPYSGRSRQTSVGDSQRNTTNTSSSTSQGPIRSKPTIVQNDHARPGSPQKPPQGRDYYATPAISKEPRKETHKKVYSVDKEGTASLVADVNAPKEGERHHRRKGSENGERGGYIRAPTERDRSRRAYHLNGGSTRRTEKSVEDDDAYSYTNAAGMFRDTEPSWREREPRPRRNSVDRSGGSRERPISVHDPDFRRPSKDIGPPPSTRGWDRLNEISRSASTREKPKGGPQSPTLARAPLSPPEPRMPQSPSRGRNVDAGGYGDPRDPYYVAPRTATGDDRRYVASNRDRSADRYEPIDYREPRRPQRRNSTTRAPEQSTERRGFGIRRDDSQDRYGRRREDSQDRYAPRREESQDRYAPRRDESADVYGRGSDERFSQQNQYRDSDYAFPPPQRRETAPDMSQQDEQRLERERRDRLQDRDVRDREPRRRDEDAASYGREYDRDRPSRKEPEYDVDKERERERERMLQPQPEPEKLPYRSGSHRDRDYEYRENGSRDSGETVAQPGLSTAAAGGLAAAATAYGIGSYRNRHDESERERGRDLDPNQRRDRSQEHDRDRVSPRPKELRPPQDARPLETHSDEGAPYQQDRGRSRPEDHDRGLGFAFEHPPPEPPKSAPPLRDRSDTATSRDANADRDFERMHEDNPPADPDEDYRRRKEQVQRELGRAPDDRATDSDPERERRRREREQRLREREPRNGEAFASSSTNAYADPSAPLPMPGSFDNESVDDTESTVTARTLRRRPSILDEPMSSEPAQIIDNSMSERRENRVRIVDPPTEEEERRPKGILKKPKEKFPEHPDDVREGVAPLKDSSKSGIPPGARWTKIDRRLVNPEALEDAKERFEERLDCVIVLRVLTKEDIQKLADRTKAIRDERYHEEREEKKSARRRDRDRDRRERDEYEDDSENEFKPRAPKMLTLEAPASAGASSGEKADFTRETKDRRRDREGDRESQYVSSGRSRRDEYSDR